MKWDPSKLPFLPEKLKFREDNVADLDRNSTILCVYAGGEAKLTKMYAERFDKVYAVDVSFPEEINAIKVQMKDSEFVKRVNEFINEDVDVLDVDPYGSPMPFLKAFFHEFEHTVRRILITDGILTSIKLKRFVNLQIYNLCSGTRAKPKTWHYRHFPCILFSGIKDLVQEYGYKIEYFDYEYNRYKTALYARFDLKR